MLNILLLDYLPFCFFFGELFIHFFAQFLCSCCMDQYVISISECSVCLFKKTVYSAFVVWIVLQVSVRFNKFVIVVFFICLYYLPFIFAYLPSSIHHKSGILKSPTPVNPHFVEFVFVYFHIYCNLFVTPKSLCGKRRWCFMVICRNAQSSKKIVSPNKHIPEVNKAVLVYVVYLNFHFRGWKLQEALQHSVRNQFWGQVGGI